MFASLAMLLEWSGYQLPLARQEGNWPPENFVHRLHLASGVPIETGSTTHDTRVALRALLPGTPIHFGTLSKDEFIRELENGAAIRVTAKLDDMPHDMTSWSGRGDGNHAYAVIGTRIGGPNNVRQVYWLDPMGRPGADYEGEWFDWDHVNGHLKHNAAGELYVTLTYKSAASDANTDSTPDVFKAPADAGVAEGNMAGAVVVPPNVEEGTMQLVNWSLDRTGDVKEGTRIYDLNRRFIKVTSGDWTAKPILAESANGNYLVFGHKLGGRKVVVAVERGDVDNDSAA